VEVTSKDPVADATRILREFARRAFRRPVDEDEIRPYSPAWSRSSSGDSRSNARSAPA
jgi:hypothetical protein